LREELISVFNLEEKRTALKLFLLLLLKLQAVVVSDSPNAKLDCAAACIIIILKNQIIVYVHPV
jgi:hypothetical protein